MPPIHPHLRAGQARPTRPAAPCGAARPDLRDRPPPSTPSSSSTRTRASASRRDLLLAAAAAAPCACAFCASRTAAGRAAYKRFFARAMAEMMGEYEDRVAPVKARLFAQNLAPLRARAAGPLEVLDLGVGAAPNAKYLASSASASAAGPGGLGVGRVVGVDPNPFMFSYATAAAAAAGFSVACGEDAALAALDGVGEEGGADTSTTPSSSSSSSNPRPTFSTIQAPAEALPFPDAAFDAVVCTLVLCSVSSVPGALAEAARVLRPGGRLIFCEHTAAPWAGRPLMRAAQAAADPLQRALADGCHLTRDPAGAIAGAPGLRTLSLDRFDVPGMAFIAPHVAGAAERV
jgi:ubiquinone/menaquinone biosynthesis C-methylase UbiE